MKDFHLIDLISQRDSVKDLLQGLDEVEILGWLSSKGRVESWPTNFSDGKDIYLFTSILGKEAKFYFFDGELVFLGDHYTFT